MTRYAWAVTTKYMLLHGLRYRAFPNTEAYLSAGLQLGFLGRITGTQVIPWVRDDDRSNQYRCTHKATNELSMEAVNNLSLSTWCKTGMILESKGEGEDARRQDKFHRFPGCHGKWTCKMRNSL